MNNPRCIPKHSGTIFADTANPTRRGLRKPEPSGGHARKAFDNQVALLEGLDLHLDEKGATKDPCNPNYIVLPGDLSDWICPEKGDVDAKNTQSHGKPKIESSMAGVPAHCRAPGMIVTKG